MDGERLDTCPRRPFLDQPEAWNRVFQLYRLYDKGTLLQEGGVDDQPHHYLEVMAMVDAAVGQIQKHHLDKSKSTVSKGSAKRVKSGGRKR